MKRVLKIGAGVLVAMVLACVVFVLVRASSGDLRFPDVKGPDVTASTDPAVVARGAYLVHAVAHCSQCHGAYTRMEPAKNTADIALSGGMDFVMGPMGAFYASNLTPAGIGARSDGELARAIAAGVLHDGRLSIFMRYSAANLSQEDLVAVISYLRSLAPVKNDVAAGGLSTLGKAAFSFLTMSPDTRPLPAHVPELAPGAEPTLERGAYLAEHVALCVACHTTYDPMTFEPNGPKAAGGVIDPSHGTDTDKEFVAPNLTAAKSGITGKLSEDEFLARLKQGRVFASSIMPWENFTRMTESDARSVYRYLRSLPPVENDVGPTYRDIGSHKP